MWARNCSFGFFSFGLCVGRKTKCAICAAGFRLAANVWSKFSFVVTKLINRKVSTKLNLLHVISRIIIFNSFLSEK